VSAQIQEGSSMKPSRLADHLADVVLKLCRFSAVPLLIVVPLFAQTSGPTPSRQRSSAEQRTSRALELVRANPLELHAFLVNMPKGADLHNHLSGAIYAESWVRAGAEDGLCVNPASPAFVKPPHISDNSPANAACEPSNVPAAQAYKDQRLYDALIDAFSMRGYVPSPGITGHDHFFSTF
jgi:adenosine deaminase